MTYTTVDNPKHFPDIVTFAPGDIIPDALILTAANVVAEIKGDAQALLVPFVTDETDAEYVAEAQPGTPGKTTFDHIEIKTRKIMKLTKMSREVTMFTETAQQIADSMARAVIRKANRDFINGDGEGSTPVGIANTPGITTTAKLGNNLDVIIDAIAGIEAADGHATTVITDPATWATVSKMKAGTGSNLPLLGAPGQLGARELLGLPVHVSNDVETGTMLIYDKTAIPAAAGELQVAVTSDAYFDSDVIGRRITWRIGWGVAQPDRVAKVTLTDV